jgi:hypothetical protein
LNPPNSAVACAANRDLKPTAYTDTTSDLRCVSKNIDHEKGVETVKELMSKWQFQVHIDDDT